MITRKYPHNLRQNFYVDRNGSLKEKKNISNASIEGALDMPFPEISSSLPIIPFSPNTVPNCDESTVYTDNQDLSEGYEDEEYSSMLFVTTSASLENIIDVAKKELFDNENENESDESDCDSYASICFNTSPTYREETETFAPDYLDMNKLRELIRM